MRRHNRNPSPRYSVIREKSSYTESESEIAKGNRYRVDRYSRERASPDYREEFPDGRTKSPRDPFNTLLIRRFSSKLDDSAIQEYIFNDFDRFGELSVRMGTYAGERAAFINFKYMEDALEAIREKPKVYLHDRNLVVEPISSSDSHDIHGGILTTGGGFRRNDAINAAPGKMSSDISNLYDRHRREMHASASTSISSDLHHANTGSVIAHSGSVISMSGPNASTSASILGMPVGIAAAAPAMMAAARALGLARGSGNGLVSATGTVPGTSEVLLTDPGSLGGLLGATAAPVRPHRFAPVQPPSTPPHRHRNERPSSPLDDGDIFEADPSATRTLFVGGLEADISETEIHEAFSRFGSAEHVDIKRPATGVNGGHVYAFVRFANVDQAARAKAEMSGRCIRSLHCKIGFGKPIPSTAVYVSGRDIWGRTEALDRLLSRFGRIVALNFHKSQMAAVVLYENAETAKEACQHLKGLQFGRSGHRLRADFIDPDNSQQALASPPKSTSRSGISGIPTHQQQHPGAPNHNTFVSTGNSILGGIGSRLGPPPDSEGHDGRRFFINTSGNAPRRYDNYFRGPGAYTGQPRAGGHMGLLHNEDRRHVHNISRPPILSNTGLSPDRHGAYGVLGMPPGPTSVSNVSGGLPFHYRQNIDGLGDLSHKSSASDALKNPLEKNCLLSSVNTLDDLSSCLQPWLGAGRFMLKNSRFYCRFLFVSGDKHMVDQLMTKAEDAQLEEARSNPSAEIDKLGNNGIQNGLKDSTSKLIVLDVEHRITLDVRWMAEAVDEIQNAISDGCPDVALLLGLTSHLPASEPEYMKKCDQRLVDHKLDDDDACHDGTKIDAISELANITPRSLACLVAYLRLKQSCGIASISEDVFSDTEEEMKIKKRRSSIKTSFHIFPPSSFALSLLKQTAPRLSPELASSDNYIVVLLTRRPDV